MPHIDGRALADQARTICPSIRVLCVSSHANQALSLGGTTGPELRFLEKPFGLKELLSSIHELLD